jgi:transcriptional regulator with XRE-family HTH domain
MRDSAFGPPAIPPQFWARPDVRSALISHDVGAVFRLLRQHTGISQTRIGTAVDMAQGRVSNIELGKQHIAGAAVFARIADGLNMPDHARASLGLAPRSHSTPGQATPPGTDYPATTEQALSDLTGLWQTDMRQPRELTSLTPDAAAWNAAALSWLVAPETSGAPLQTGSGRRVGQAEIHRVRQTADVLGRLDNQFGGAHSRRALIAYLNGEAATLLNGSYTDDTGRDLFAAVAEAALLAAWMSYDSGLHGLAQRYFVQALRLAESASDKRLGCSILSAMSHQANYVGHLTEAANLARAAQAAVRPVSTPTLLAQFQAMEARALASQGDVPGCHAALAAAERSLGHNHPDQDPEFIRYFDQAELADEFAHCFRDLTQYQPAAEHAARASATYDADSQRSDFFATMILADACLGQGETEQACQAALDALQLGETLTSARCVTYLAQFRQRLDRAGDTVAVREFREQARPFTLWAKTA